MGDAMSSPAKEQLQKRINLALSERSGRASRFSPYTSAEWIPLTERLVKSQRGEGLTRIETALDEFDRLERSHDHKMLQYALLNYLVQHADLAAVGLRIPSIEERFSTSVQRRA
jgi:hypothetical protein